jgi:hypothetical protein
VIPRSCVIESYPSLGITVLQFANANNLFLTKEAKSFQGYNDANSRYARRVFMSLVFLADSYNREHLQRLPIGRTIDSHELQSDQFSLITEPNLTHSMKKTSFQMHLSVSLSNPAELEGDIYAPTPVVIEFK